MRPPRLPAVLLGCALLLPACGTLFQTASAVVNGRRIEDGEFQRGLRFFLADPSVARQFPGDRPAAQRQYLTFLIQQELIDQFAEANGVDVTDQEVEQRFRAQVAQLGGDEAFGQRIAQASVSEEDVRDLVRQQALRDRVIQAVVGAEVSEIRLRQEFDARAPEFTDVHVAHILVPTRELAEDLLGRATPANFPRLAARFSQDPGSAPAGGDLGLRRASEFDDAFARAALFIPVGEIGGPVETQFGFHVIHVLERTPVPFEEARDQLLQELAPRVFAEWLRERVAAADVRVNPRYGTFAPGLGDAGEVVELQATTPEPEVQLTP